MGRKCKTGQQLNTQKFRGNNLRVGDFLSEVHSNSDYTGERKKMEENTSEYSVEREREEEGNSNTKTFFILLFK